MRRLVIALLAVAVLLVVADFGAAAATESVVSGQLRQQLGLVDDPAVRINGFPFLTQAISGHYPSVDVDADRVHVGELQNVEVHAQLLNARAPLSELFGSGPKSLVVARVYGTVRISADDLQRLLPEVDKLHIDSVDDNALDQAVRKGGDESLTSIDPAMAARLSGTVTLPLLGRRDVSAIATVQIVGGQIQLVPRDIQVSAVGGGDPQTLPAAVARALGAMFTVRIDPGTLPFHVTPTRARVVNGMLELTGTTADLVLGTGAVAARR